MPDSSTAFDGGNSLRFGSSVSASGSTHTTGSSLSTGARSVTSATPPGITAGVVVVVADYRRDGGRGARRETAEAAPASTDRKLFGKPEAEIVGERNRTTTTTTHCCSAVSALPTQDRTALESTGGALLTVSAAEFVTRSEPGGSVQAPATVNSSAEPTHPGVYTSSGNIDTADVGSSNDSWWSTVTASHDDAATSSQTANASVELSTRYDRTFNMMFAGDCAALRRRGVDAERRFRAVVVDALSSGLSLSPDRLVAGDVRCGSLNLSVTLLNASDDDVRALMSTIADATLRVSVEYVDRPFVLTRVEVEVAAAGTAGDRSGSVTDRPEIGRRGSVAILVVFVMVGALAVLAGTVSAAVYVYFRRIYCRTFVVNRRALRWSSSASDTVQVTH